MKQRNKWNKLLSLLLVLALTLSLTFPMNGTVKAQTKDADEKTQVTVEMLKVATALKNTYSADAPMTMESVDYNGKPCFNRTNFRALFYMLRGGISCDELYNQFMDSAKALMENGSLKEGYHTLEAYSGLILLCKAKGEDPQTKFVDQSIDLNEDMLALYDQYLDGDWTSFNPYYYNQVVEALEAAWNTETDLIAKGQIKVRIQKIMNRILANCKNSQEDGYGYNYWGLSPDNDGTVLTALKYYDEAANVTGGLPDGGFDAQKVSEFLANAVSYEKKTYLKEDGTADGGYGANADSTALMLAFLSMCEDQTTDAAKVYQGLLTYKANDKSGLYEGYSKQMATVDAAEGILTYECKLCFGGTSPYNVTALNGNLIAANNAVAVNKLVNNLPEISNVSKDDMTAVQEIEEVYGLLSKASQSLVLGYERCEQVRKAVEAIKEIILAPMVTTTQNVTTTQAGVTTTATNSTISDKKVTLTLKKKSGKVKVGKKLKIKATVSNKGKITYQSKNKKIATVSKKGVIKGKKKGSTKIKVTSAKITKYFSVKVVK